jgi:hypothetical protein
VDDYAGSAGAAATELQNLGYEAIRASGGFQSMREEMATHGSGSCEIAYALWAFGTAADHAREQLVSWDEASQVRVLSQPVQSDGAGPLLCRWVRVRAFAGAGATGQRRGDAGGGDGPLPTLAAAAARGVQGAGISQVRRLCCLCLPATASPLVAAAACRESP